MDAGDAKWKLAVLASGDGSNLQAILDGCLDNRINGVVSLVISNKMNAYALMRAKQKKIETLVFDPAKFQSRTVWCSKMAKAMKEREIDLVCLAGFMMKLEACMIRSFPNRIINIHPALLPKYGGKGMYGSHVHEAVLAAKEEESGCTIHMVDEIYDHGTILAQSKVPVSPEETAMSLAEKIHVKEHELYVKVLADICSGKISLNGVKA